MQSENRMFTHKGAHFLLPSCASFCQEDSQLVIKLSLLGLEQRLILEPVQGPASPNGAGPLQEEALNPNDSDMLDAGALSLCRIVNLVLQLFVCRCFSVGVFMLNTFVLLLQPFLSPAICLVTCRRLRRCLCHLSGFISTDILSIEIETQFELPQGPCQPPCQSFHAAIQRPKTLALLSSRGPTDQRMLQQRLGGLLRKKAKAKVIL